MQIHTKAVNCAFCGHDCELTLHNLFDDRFGSPGTYNIFRCKFCGLEQTWPRPSEIELKQLYEHYYNRGAEKDSLYYRIRERFLVSPWYRFYLKWDGDIAFHLRCGHGRLLDVGCNEGRGLRHYAMNGFEAEGLEINEKAAAVAQSHGFRVSTLPLAKFRPHRPFDVVVLTNVLEHSVDPVEMLRQVHGFLKPNGQVWISCPNAASYWRKLFGHHWVNWHVPYHLWHFTPATLMGVLNRAQFRVDSLETCTPSLWLAQSFCVKLDNRVDRANRLMRSPAAVAFFTLTLRVLGYLPQTALNQRLKGDCIIVTAHSQERIC